MEQNHENTTVDNKKGKNQSTRTRLVKTILQQVREEIIRLDIEVKFLENLKDRGTYDEIAMVIDVNMTIDDLIDRYKKHMNVLIIKLETLKEMRDGKPDINTEENRKLVENSPVVNVLLKK